MEETKKKHYKITLLRSTEYDFYVCADSKENAEKFASELSEKDIFNRPSCTRVTDLFCLAEEIPEQTNLIDMNQKPITVRVEKNHESKA